MFQDFINRADRNDFERAFNVIGNIRKVLLIILRDKNCSYPCTQSGKKFLF